MPVGAMQYQAPTPAHSQGMRLHGWPSPFNPPLTHCHNLEREIIPSVHEAALHQIDVAISELHGTFWPTHEHSFGGKVLAIVTTETLSFSYRPLSQLPRFLVSKVALLDYPDTRSEDI
jgi:hypothetical protein